MGRSMYPTTFADAFTGSFTRAVPHWMQKERPARVPRRRPAILSKPRPTHPRGPTLTQAPLRAPLSRRERRWRWLLLGIVFTTGAWAVRLARVVMAPKVQAHR